MSAITEAANREALKAEQEHPDEEEAAEEEAAQPEPEHVSEPEQPAEPESHGLSEQEAEAEFKKLEKLAQNYLKRAVAIADRLGMPYAICPLDAFPGLAVPRQAHEVTSDVEAAVLGLIGKLQAPDLREAVDAEACPDCEGWGDVLTGAKKDISKTKPCTRCGGKGWVQKIAPIAAVPANGAATYPGVELPYTPLPQGIPDAWGRPAGHPHWGRDPREIGV